MKRTFILLLLLSVSAAGLTGQTKEDLVTCIKTALASPEMKTAFTQEWGDFRPLYLQKPERRNIGIQPIEELMQQLEAEDFTGFQWEVIPMEQEAIQQLASDEREFGVLNLSALYREGWEAMSLNISVTLPRYPRQWLTGSFVLEKRSGAWKITQKSVEIDP